MRGRALWIGVVGLALAPRAHGGVVMNEIFADASLVDANCDGILGTQDDEFVEIVNTGAADVDLSGATLSDAGGVQHTFAAGTLVAPWEGIVVFAGGTPQLDGTSGSAEAWCVALPPTVQVVVATPVGLSLNNSADTVTLADAVGLVLDTVVYGNEANADKSIVRDPELTGAVFVQHPGSPVSPGTMVGGDVFALPPVDTGPIDTAPPASSVGTVLINELLPAVAGADDGYEWVEIVNIGPTDVDLLDWTLQRATTGSFGVRYTFPAWLLGPGERLVLGEELVPADLNLAAGVYLALGNATATADAVRLVDASGVVIDTVVYGSPNSDAFVDDSGAIATSLAPTPVDDVALARIPDASDTDASGVDFVAVVGTPGFVNVEPVIDTGDTGDTGATIPPPASSAWAGQVVVNELLVDPLALGADGTHEWVELLNVSGAAVELDGWSIERAKSTWDERYTFGPTLLQPGARLLVGESDVVGADIYLAAGSTLDFGNAGSNGDAVRLVDAMGLAVDTVIYGPDNADAFLGDDGLVATSIAPKMGADESVARIPDGADTDDSGVDFWLVAAPTPGAANLDPRDACADGSEAAGVVINELDASTTGAEWVEVFNGAADAVDLSGWTLAYGNQTYSGGVPIPEGTTVAAGAFLVIGAIPEATVAADIAMGNATSNSDGVRLEDCVGGVVDSVVYGAPNDSAFVDDSGEVATSLAPAPASGSTLARLSDGHDTDLGGDDFVLQIEPTPGGSNPEVVPVICEPSTGVVTINEIVPDPEDTDEGFEWIELYNGGSAEVSVAGWTLSAATKSFDDASVTIPGGTAIPAGGWLVIGGLAVAEADVVASFSLGNGTGGDGVRLFDCEAAVVDTVLYGDSSDDGLPDDNNVPAEPYGDPGAGESFARVTDGADSDAAEDWDERGSPTPGASNVLAGGGGGYEAPKAGCGCGGGPDGAPPTTNAPGGGGCRTVPLPLGGLEGLVALVATLRRRRRAGERSVVRRFTAG